MQTAENNFIDPIMKVPASPDIDTILEGDSGSKAREQLRAADRITEEFEHKRMWWTERIKELSPRFKDIYKMATLQVELYSDRQVLLEYQHSIMRHSATLGKYIKEAKRKKFLKYTNDYELRLSSAEKAILIDADLNKLKERQEQFDNQIEFCRESIKTYDSMIFGVKHRISIEELTRG